LWCICSSGRPILNLKIKICAYSHRVTIVRNNNPILCLKVYCKLLLNKICSIVMAHFICIVRRFWFTTLRWTLALPDFKQFLLNLIILWVLLIRLWQQLFGLTDSLLKLEIPLMGLIPLLCVILIIFLCNFRCFFWFIFLHH
jgi:hypothetical protein